MIFPDVLWPPSKCNEPTKTTSKPYDAPKIFQKPKEVENWEGTKNVRNPHILRILVNFLVFLDFDFSGCHFTTFYVQWTYLNNIQAIWYPKIFKKPNEEENLEGTKNVRIPQILRTLVNFLKNFRFWFFRMSFDHVLTVTNLLKQHPSHMMPQKVLKSPKKWRILRVQRMWGFLTFFVPL